MHTHWLIYNPILRHGSDVLLELQCTVQSRRLDVVLIRGIDAHMCVCLISCLSYGQDVPLNNANKPPSNSITIGMPMNKLLSIIANMMKTASTSLNFCSRRPAVCVLNLILLLSVTCATEHRTECMFAWQLVVGPGAHLAKKVPAGVKVRATSRLRSSTDLVACAKAAHEQRGRQPDAHVAETVSSCLKWLRIMSHHSKLK